MFGTPGGTAARTALEAAACDFGAAATTAHDTEDDGEDDNGADNDSDNNWPPVDALATDVTSVQCSDGYALAVALGHAVIP